MVTDLSGGGLGEEASPCGLHLRKPLPWDVLQVDLRRDTQQPQCIGSSLGRRHRSKTWRGLDKSKVWWVNCSGLSLLKGLPWWLSGKDSTCQFKQCTFNFWVRRIPWRKERQHIPRFLGNSMDRGSWWATVHGTAKIQTRMSD